MKTTQRRKGRRIPVRSPVRPAVETISEVGPAVGPGYLWAPFVLAALVVFTMLYVQAQEARTVGPYGVWYYP